MRHSQKSAPQVNAGSMADIAFLLLIFFLVTTTISADKGINRKLPPECPPGTICSEEINERNILRINLNSKNELMVDDEIIELKELKDLTKLFIDNNGEDNCSYCDGKGLNLFSDHPKKAVVSLSRVKLQIMRRLLLFKTNFQKPTMSSEKFMDMLFLEKHRTN